MFELAEPKQMIRCSPGALLYVAAAVARIKRDSFAGSQQEQEISESLG
jgi:hypothetical protein